MNGNGRGVLGRCTAIVAGTSPADAPAHLIAVLGFRGLLAARAEALEVLNGAGHPRVREVLRVLDVIDEAVERVSPGRGTAS